MQPFSNSDDQAFYQQNGYITKPLLSAEEVLRLSNWFQGYLAESNGRMHATIESDDLEYRRGANELVQEILGPHVERLMPGYRPIFGGFVAKPPAEGGIMEMHCDWQYVDLDAGPSFSFWIPLQQVDMENGAVQVIPGSHQHVHMLRGQNALNPYSRIKDNLLASNVRSIPQPAGEALIFDHALIHGSGVNHTPLPRLAVTLTLAPKEAQLVHLYREPSAPENELQRFEVDADFYLDYKLGNAPAGEATNTLTDDKMASTINKLTELYCGTSGPFYKDQTTALKRRKVMVDAADDKAIEEEGYVIKPLLSPEEVAEVAALFDQDTLGLNLPLTSSTWIKDSEYKRKIHQQIVSIFAPKLQELLIDYKPLSGAFIMKNPGEGSHLTTHFDWQFVDERRFISLHVWIPLVDVDEHNGAFQILPKSHNMVNAWRGRFTPDSIFFNNRTIKPEAKKTLPMKAGEALIYDNRLIHGTPPNYSDKPRLAAGLVLIPEEATSLHVYTTEDKMFDPVVELYEVDETFYYGHDINAKPEGFRFLGRVEDKHRDESFRQIDEAFLEPKQEPQPEPELAEVTEPAEPVGLLERIKRTLWG